MDIKEKLETVRNLLNKNVSNGATEEEAMQALALAKKLMSKYSITMDDLKKQKISSDDFVHGSNKKTEKGNRTNVFEKMVSVAIGKYTDTIPNNYKYNVPGAKNMNSIIKFFGYAVDVQLAIYMLDVCVHAFEVEWSKYKNVHKCHGNKKQVFGYAMAQRIMERIMELMIEEQHKTTSTDLIVIKNQIVLQMYEESLKQTGATIKGGLSVSIREDGDTLGAFEAGYKAGEKVELHRKFEKNKTLMLENQNV